MARSRITADYPTLNLQTQVTTINDRLVGFIGGLTLSRASVTTFGVAVGSARSENSGTSRLLGITSAFTKSLSAWAIGSGNGALDTGSIAASSWYHVHVIRRDSDGAIDILLSLSATAPTMPGGWVARRRIGSIRTNVSSQITAFVQVGDVFVWDVPVSDVAAANPGAAAVTRALTVPTGVAVLPVTAWSIENLTTAAIQALISPLSIADTAPAVGLANLTTFVLNGGSFVQLSDIPTNTSAQVRTRLSASGATDTLRATTFGWIDRRGAA